MMRCNDYRIKDVTYASDSNFGAYKPIDYQKEEQVGIMDWNGSFLPFIPTSMPILMSALPSALEQLINHAWRDTPVSAAAKTVGRGPIQMGGHRAPPVASSVPGMPPLPAIPDPAYKRISTPATSGPAFSMQSQLSPHLKTAFAQDWAAHKEIPRVNAYAFRGDSRDPAQIKQAAGFTPPISRTDDYYIKNTVYPQFRAYLKNNFDLDVTEAQLNTLMSKTFSADLKKEFIHYSVWRATLERESLHLGRMLAFEALKGFISTTKAVTVAKAYAGTSGGYVYVMSVNGGYHLPAKGGHTWTTIFGEQEIAYPGAIPWEMVQGFREVGADKKFTGNIYLRESFEILEKDAAVTVLKLLSGKKQV